MGWRACWDVPAEVVDRWVDSHGPDAVRDWLAEVHVLAGSCASAWRLSIEGVLEGGSLSCVLGCRRADGGRAVLKLLPPWAEGAIATEALALSAWGGYGVVSLLDSTADGRALLLSRVSPGHCFAPSGNEADDCRRVAAALRALASASVPRELPPLSRALRARFARARDAGRLRREWVTARAGGRGKACLAARGDCWPPEAGARRCAEQEPVG